MLLLPLQVHTRPRVDLLTLRTRRSRWWGEQDRKDRRATDSRNNNRRSFLGGRKGTIRGAAAQASKKPRPNKRQLAKQRRNSRRCCGAGWAAMCCSLGAGQCGSGGGGQCRKRVGTMAHPATLVAITSFIVGKADQRTTQPTSSSRSGNKGKSKIPHTNRAPLLCFRFCFSPLPPSPTPHAQQTHNHSSSCDDDPLSFFPLPFLLLPASEAGGRLSDRKSRMDSVVHVATLFVWEEMRCV